VTESTRFLSHPSLVDLIEIQAMSLDFVFEYEYSPSPDAEERMAQAWELLLALILEDLQAEQEADPENAE